MEQTQLFMVIAGTVAALLVVMLTRLMALRSKDQALVAALGSLKDALTPALDALQKQADTVLAAYGGPLKPAHDAIAVVQSLVDEPSDWLVQQIGSDAVITAIRDALARFEALTDGVPEGAPLAERKEGAE